MVYISHGCYFIGFSHDESIFALAAYAFQQSLLRGRLSRGRRSILGFLDVCNLSPLADREGKG